MTTDSLITSEIKNSTTLKIPIAHADGRYYADDITLNELVKHDQIIFKYSDGEGNITDEANLNGSMMNIAGICNLNRNVYGMMPHPERAAESVLGNTDGLILLQSMLKNLSTVTV